MATACLTLLLLAVGAAAQLSDSEYSTNSGVRATLLKSGGGLTVALNATTSEKLNIRLARIVEVDELGYEIVERRITRFDVVQPVVTSGECMSACMQDATLARQPAGVTIAEPGVASLSQGHAPRASTPTHMSSSTTPFLASGCSCSAPAAVAGYRTRPSLVSPTVS